MFNNIIVPIDLTHTERADAMIKAAKHMGGPDAKITVINVFDEIPGYVAAELPADTIENSKKMARDRLQEVVTSMDLKAEAVIRSGQPARCILDLAEDNDADLIIIASHKPGLQDYLLGSTAARVVRHAKCPVLVLR
jgi:nucleotide-binding universal stress UspA family protein